MTRYFVLSLSLVLILLVLTCSGYLNNTTSLYYETPIDTESSSKQEELLSGDKLSRNDLSLTNVTPTPSPEMSQGTPAPIEIEALPVDVPDESAAPSSTPEPQVQISDLPDWYKSIENGTKVPILMYHNLLESSDAGDGLNVSKEAFDDQMYQLKAYGYNTITFNNLYEHYMNGSPLPENPVIISFDDGYESNYTIGYPILKKYSFNACIFIITNAIGNKGYLGESQLKEITSSGVIDIQNHSASHSYDLPVMSENKIKSELSESKKRLDSITGSKVNIFCYPIGKYSQRLIDELIEQEYIFSVTTKYGIASKKTNPFLLPRIRVMGSDSGKDLKSKIENLTKRPTKFIGIPEATSSPEPYTEPIIEPGADPSTSPEPGTSIEPGTTPEPESETEPNSDVEDETDSNGSSKNEHDVEPKTDPEPEPTPAESPITNP